MPDSGSIARLIVEVEPDHLDRPFDYTIPDDLRGEVRPGSRVEVVFAGRRTRGLVTAVTDTSSVPDAQLRPLRRVFGAHVWADDEDRELFRWAARRFAAPVAAVVRHALPARVVDVERRAADAGWFPDAHTDRGDRADGRPPTLEADEEAWEVYGADGEWLRSTVAEGSGAAYWRPLPGEDLGARLCELVAMTLDGGRDALVILPEPVSVAADTLVERFGDLSVDVRGDAGNRRVYRAWLRGRCGDARVIIGERRVAFWPLRRLGLTVVVDEASPAHKERRAPRHHTREVALERARRAGGVGLLVGGVPSAIAWRLLAERRLRPVTPVRTIERRAAPVVHVDDRRGPDSRGRFGGRAIDALRSAVEDGSYGVVLAARRGEGRVLACTRCAERLSCPRCSSTLATLSAEDGGATVVPILCEGCGWRPSGRSHTCPVCGGDRFAPLAAGARRIGDELSRTLSDVEVAVLEGYARPAPPPPAVLVMTRGSAQLDPPGEVGAVVLPDVDGQLRRPILDAAEDTLRLALRVAAWSATVVVQTREPAHHAVQALVRWDPGGFWRTEVLHRAEVRFPPAAHAIRLDADEEDGDRVAGELRSALPSSDEVLGPRPTEGGRAGLLLKCDDRVATVAALRPLREAWSRDGAAVRVDVDPVDVT